MTENAARTVWVLTANAPDSPGVMGVYVSPEAAQRANPGDWQKAGDGWIVRAPVVDSAYGGVLDAWEVESA